MFNRKPKCDPGLEEAIDGLLNEMNSVMSDSPEYAKMVDQLAKLYTIRDANRPKGVSQDTLAIIAGNISGILIIVLFEKANVWTSKALNFALKLR
jgi:hypothetical protein